MYIIRKKSDHQIHQSAFCGRLAEVLRPEDYGALDIAMLENVQETIGHYHRTFDEIYVVTAGSLKVAFFDPKADKRWVEQLDTDELCVIPKNLHHKILGGSTENKLLVVCIPRFELSDEYRSEILEAVHTERG